MKRTDYYDSAVLCYTDPAIEQGKTMKHAAIWVYDSLGHGERQQRECEEVARGFGYETVAAFVSGGVGRNEAWANLVSFVKSGGADLVVAYSPSRIGACHEEFEERKNFLESAGVTLHLICPE